VVAIIVLLAQRFSCRNGRKKYICQNGGLSAILFGKLDLLKQKKTALGFEHDPETKRRIIKWKRPESDLKLKLAAQNVINPFLSA
jgi:hypothetical protein